MLLLLLLNSYFITGKNMIPPESYNNPVKESHNIVQFLGGIHEMTGNLSRIFERDIYLHVFVQLVSYIHSFIHYVTLVVSCFLVGTPPHTTFLLAPLEVISSQWNSWISHGITHQGLGGKLNYETNRIRQSCRNAEQSLLMLLLVTTPWYFFCKQSVILVLKTPPVATKWQFSTPKEILKVVKQEKGIASNQFMWIDLLSRVTVDDDPSGAPTG